MPIYRFWCSDWFFWVSTPPLLVKWFLLVKIAFIRHLHGFICIKCVIRQFLASQDLIVDVIFECSDRKNRKSTTKKPKKAEKTEKKGKKPQAIANFKFGTGFFGFIRFFLGCDPPPPNLHNLQTQFSMDFEFLEFMLDLDLKFFLKILHV